MTPVFPTVLTSVRAETAVFPPLPRQVAYILNVPLKKHKSLSAEFLQINFLETKGQREEEKVLLDTGEMFKKRELVKIIPVDLYVVPLL